MEKKVLDAMKNAGKPVRPGELAKIIGEESKEISKIISGLKKKGKVISPKRCYYSLSDEQKAAVGIRFALYGCELEEKCCGQVQGHITKNC